MSVAPSGGERERFELRLDGRPHLFTADRGHVHHRLLDRGYPHAVAVRILWTLSLLAGAATVAAALWDPVRTLLLALMIGLATYLVLFQLRYQELGVLRKGLLLPLFDQGILRRTAFHRVVDGTLAALAFAMAYIVAHRLSGDVLLSGMLRTLPVAVAVELSAFQVTGLYRGAYRHAGVGEALRVIRSTALGSTAAAVGLGLTFGLGWGELATYVLNGLLLVMLVLGSRVSFRVLDYFHGRGRAEGAPTLLYGAGRAGDLALRELLSNPHLGWRPVGFIDDHPGQRGRFRAGYPILGGLTELEQVVEQYGVKQVVVTTRKLTQARWSRLLEAAARLNLRVTRFTLDWEPVRVKAARRVSKPAQPVASAQPRAHQ
jgi:UDP-GlcNAc:undecaprenyl-phosphate GlcNAc-1-phosphate transferase